jgi:hypothetical protein
MNVIKKLMAVLRIVPTLMDHTLAAVILAIVLAVMDTPAMVIMIVQVYTEPIFINNHRY